MKNGNLASLILDPIYSMFLRNARICLKPEIRYLEKKEEGL